ncbi:MAG: zf-HC2 domain-containing protein [Deltaproteobacteria bacterium]|nr:zf-HC2 domain-containing protein [Deltaproteobacteria bacterium]
MTRRRKRTTQRRLNCRKATSLIAAYLAGELDPLQTVAFENHLRDCADCLAFLNTYKKTIELAQAFLKHSTAAPKPYRPRCPVDIEAGR